MYNVQINATSMNFTEGNFMFDIAGETKANNRPLQRQDGMNRRGVSDSRIEQKESQYVSCQCVLFQHPCG